ncbi:hypothetical protein SDC9_52054 [bioreactor metagenome]|uniref:TadE-like domain-containing protein n=1 Tax=bioreactor metagenome TaxID=1076179 RepID=A0A644WQ00_9ZZZZ
MRLKSEKGQAMVEFALVLPLLILLLCAIIDVGWIFGNQLLANNAAREAARYTAVHYYDSSTDNDTSIAAGIVAARAPTLVTPIITLSKSVSGNEITVSVSSQVTIPSPLLSSLFAGGEYMVAAQCTMKLE